jgi:dipeptidyl aminopeptidase/acylaminoacyl peptidase
MFRAPTIENLTVPFMFEQARAEAQDASLTENAERAIRAIIRPPRARYNPDDLGPIGIPGEDIPIPRVGLTFKNRRGVTIVGSLYISGCFYTEERHPCVIYCHGNIGSQKEGRFLPAYVCPRGISVFCFDFNACGCSSGDYVTLGHQEHQDILDAINLLKNGYSMTDIILWGRSMGAASSVMASPLSPLIRGIIVDSPFESLKKLFKSISRKVPLPSMIRPIAVWWICQQVHKRVGFECSEVSPVQSAKRATVPLMLGHASDDNFVPYKQGLHIFQNWACPDKEMFTMTGGHDGTRDPGWIMKCLRFILRVFGMKFYYFEVIVTCGNCEHVGSFRDLMAIQAPAPDT